MTEDEGLEDYRKHLLVAEQKAQEDFDKTVITLSGGGLGVSFAFVANVVHGKVIVSPRLLFYAWSSWGASLAVVLFSYYLSIRALRKALRQAYAGSVYLQHPGGWVAKYIDIANTVGGILFFFGAFLLGRFIWRNLV